MIINSSAADSPAFNLEHKPMFYIEEFCAGSEHTKYLFGMSSLKLVEFYDDLYHKICFTISEVTRCSLTIFAVSYDYIRG